MEWIKDKTDISKDARVHIKSWCPDPEPEAIAQAANLAAHPVVVTHVALMPDCHVGYGMPIGGVIGCQNAVIPNAVGVDIGCGMGAIKTSASLAQLKDLSCKTTAGPVVLRPESRPEDHLSFIRSILEAVKDRIPVGEGNCHKTQQEWSEFEVFTADVTGREPAWMTESGLNRDRKNLGTLGGGNHFLELQVSEDDTIWMMLHSGSRNLGMRVASFYHKLAGELNARWHTGLPSPDLAFLPADSDEGQGYIRDMNFALRYAMENRRQMMRMFKDVLAQFLPGIEFVQEINIHHNYAAIEHHFGKNLWIHRKGATSAKAGELGIIPGSMGTPSYIVQGRGNPDSYSSCSHGAGRRMGRNDASRRLTLEECDQAMKGIVFDRWHKDRSSAKRRQAKGVEYDFGEAPQAYKDIDLVIKHQLDLVEPLVKLRPLGVIKG